MGACEMNFSDIPEQDHKRVLHLINKNSQVDAVWALFKIYNKDNEQRHFSFKEVHDFVCTINQVSQLTNSQKDHPDLVVLTRKEFKRFCAAEKAAIWYMNNPDSPKSALAHIRKAVWNMEAPEEN